MQTQTAKMIYASENVANMIAGKMTKAKGKHIVMKVTTGFQVCPVTICQGAVSPNNAAPYPHQLAGAKKLQPTSTPVSDEQTTTITLPLLKDTKAYLLVELKDGSQKWIGKSTIISWETTEIEHGGKLVTMKFETKVAKQKGLV